MKNGKKIGIIVAIVVVVIAIVGIGGYFALNDGIQKGKIVKEFAEIQELTQAEDFSMETLNEKTSRTVSSGKYAAAERAAKKYASDLFGKAFEIRDILQDEKMAQILTASNYSSDGPDFVETKKYITETKQKLEDGKNGMLECLEESKINSYIEEETSEQFSIDLYKELLAQDINMSETEKNQIETSVNQVISLLDVENEVIDFLIENKGKWEVEGEQVLFDNNSLVIKYNSYLTKLNNI